MAMLVVCVRMVFVRAVFLAVRHRAAGAVLVEVQEADHEEHGQEPAHEAQDRLIERESLGHRMRQHVKQPDAQHQPGHKAHQALHAGMSELGPKRHPAAHERGKGDQHAISD